MTDPRRLREQISALQRRVEGLRRFEDAPAEERHVMAAEALETLDTAIERLRATVDELERKNVELEDTRAALLAERRGYRELFDHAPDGYLVTDLNGVIREANLSAASLLGAEPRHLAGKPLAAFVPEDGRPAFRSELHRLRDAVEPAAYDLRLASRRRGTFEAAMRVTVARDDRGRPQALRWAIRDVSAQKHAEATIRALNAELERRVAEQSEQLEAELQGKEAWLIKAHGAAAAEARGDLFLDLVQEADAILWTLDPATGRYTFVNRRAEAILGYPAADWLDDPRFWADHISPDDREWAIAYRARHLRDGQDHEAEYRMVARDGRDVWFRESVRVLKDDRGQPRELRGLMVNISRRKKVERQLYTAKSRLAARLDDISYLYELGLRLAGGLDMGPMLGEVLAAVTSLQGAEQGAVLLHDRERDDLAVVAVVGLSDEQVAVTGRIPRGRGACGRVMETLEPVIVEDAEADPSQESFREARRLGGYRALFAHPLLTRRGDFLGVLATFFPEPHRPDDRQVQLTAAYARQAAEFLENARLHGLVEESDRRKGEYLAVMAHELRNPLGAILSATRLLHEAGPDDPALVEAREVVERQTRHMTRLVDDLLDATRLHNGTLALRREPVDLAGAVARAVADARPALDARGHELSVVVPPGPIALLADPVRLEQVLVNLLTNAAKYTEPGGRVALEAEVRGDGVELRVRDTGVGIAPEVLPKVFDLFMQAEPGADRSRKGLGIGLWIVRRLVELHGGRIAARSEGPGRGSEFVVTLPLATSPPEDLGAASPPRLADDDSPPGRVLLVDDDEDSARVLARLLRGWGHEVTVARDGPSALELFRRERPDVMLLDIGLPGMDGFEVARRLGQSGDLQGVRLVALTGFSQEADLASARALGFDDLWVKPVDPDTLRERLRRGPAKNNGA